MDVNGSVVVILGGSGLVGHAVACRLLECAPAKLVLVGLDEAEVKHTAASLRARGGTCVIDAVWGDIFAPTSLAALGRAEALSDDRARSRLVEDTLGDLTEAVMTSNLLFDTIVTHRPDAIVDCINTATALAYLDMFQSAQGLLAGAKAGSVDQQQVERHVLTMALPPLIRHVQILLEATRRVGTKAYVKIGTSGTGGMGLNIPYTHSEERPSRTLLAKAAVGGAHSLLLFLVGRTPGAPATIEIKPTAAIGWRRVGYGPIRRGGREVALSDCPTPLPLEQAFTSGASGWHDLERPLESVFVDVGENGVFARDEFETLTAVGQMECVTAEEIAELVVMELQGRPTGRDIVAAFDAATTGPTYRAGVLRQHAIDALKRLEREHLVRSVGFEQLGPPRLTKLLYESFIWSELRSSVRALAESDAAALASEASALLAERHDLRAQIVSVGIPILLPDGKRLYRGPHVVVAPDERPTEPAARGWVDLRPSNVARWISRAVAMVRLAETERKGLPSTGSDVDWTAIEPGDPIEPSRMATWIFKHEEAGERIKR